MGDDSPCARNKRSPDPTKCQDCCDEKLIDWLKKKIKKGLKEIVDCIHDCEKQFPNPADAPALAECVRGCVGPGGGLSVPIKQYLECCYKWCDDTHGSFDPPGPCKLK
ncbi:MAG: hypothetical protein ACP5VE_14545, partial [Chthonomonadales bacterium]